MLKKIVAVVLGLVFGMGLLLAPMQTAYADEDNKCVKTSILGKDGQYCDEDGNGSGIFLILGIVVNILTMGIGVLATLGIVISGFQYITSGGNPQQMAKAKRRIIEIVIGLVVYGVMWVFLQWLIPGGVFGNA